MTPAVRAAEAAGISITMHRYEHDTSAESYGQEAAEKMGLAPERVFKTLVARLDGRVLVMAVIPVATRLDLKKLAVAMGAKKADMAGPAEAERATGYVVGGISPLGGRKKLPAVVDASALLFETVFVSGGQRGLEMELSPTDLVRLMAAQTATVAAR